MTTYNDVMKHKVILTLSAHALMFFSGLSVCNTCQRQLNLVLEVKLEYSTEVPFCIRIFCIIVL